MMKKKKTLCLIIVQVFLFILVFRSFSVANAGSIPLSDVDGHWAQSTIQGLVSEEVIAGYPDGAFRPDNNITRAEFTTLIVRAFALEAIPEIAFNDIAGHWAQDEIGTAHYHGLVHGYSDTRFGPNDPMTREQMAVMIVNATKADSIENSKSFADNAKIAAWAKDSVDKAAAVGLVLGYPDDTFKPKVNATRAEAVVVLDRGRKLDVEKEITIYDWAGIYGPKTGRLIIDDDVTISADGVTLQNMIIKGDLIISEEVSGGDVMLNNVTVEGKTIVRGGGRDSPRK